MTNGLPDTWTVARLADLLAPLEDGRTLHHGWSPQCEKESTQSDDEWGVLKTTAIQAGAFLPEHHKRLPARLSPRPQHEVRAGDLLITCAGPRTRCGVPCLVRKTRPRLMLSGKMYRFRAAEDRCDCRYLEKYLLSYAAQTSIDAMKTGGNDSGLNLTHDRFKPLPIPLAPLHEQRRIVSRIEELFSEIDEGERALERAQKLVERYRQSVLKAAVTGELTRDWRERNPTASASNAHKKLEDSRARCGRKAPPVPMAEVDGLPPLPLSWTWTSLDSLAEVVGGITVDRKRSSAGCDEVPYLRVANVQRGYLDLSEVKTIVAPRERIEQLRLRHGDILFNEGGDIDKLGRGWLWQGELPLCIHQNHVFRARLYSPGPWNKLISWFGNVLGKRLFMDMGKQTTNLASLSLSKLKGVPVPLMSTEEAAEIVSRAEDALSVVDKCIDDLAMQQRGCASLRQAVLKAAFSGQLVPQDPTDEPASALLARLAVETNTAPPAPRRRGRRPTGTRA